MSPEDYAAFAASLYRALRAHTHNGFNNTAPLFSTEAALELTKTVLHSVAQVREALAE